MLADYLSYILSHSHRVSEGRRERIVARLGRGSARNGFSDDVAQLG